MLFARLRHQELKVSSSSPNLGLHTTTNMSGSVSIRKLIPGALCLLAVTILHGQSPHGEQFQMQCDACHSAASWDIPAGTSLAFDHDSTRFPLEGQHATTDCRLCHTTLVFSPTPIECASCHTDVHQQTVGMDCARCHHPDNWLVNNIAELHQEVSFPLIGAHAVANCFDCHISETDLRFDPISPQCISCHREDFEATTNPDHLAAGFSQECQECHTIAAFEWSATGIDHSFFPLTKGHDLNTCAECHTTGNFADASPVCYDCHRPDYETAQEPNHLAADLPTDCASCHTTDPEWEPAEFIAHDDLYFPIYSGSHEGEWIECRDCHANNNDYTEFTCIGCHEKDETDDEHPDVTGYTYSNTACLACHPNGLADGAFDHSATNFPLTGAHTTVNCIDCHFSGYAGTPTECLACHEKDFNQSINPSHVSLGLSTDCAMCHTTDLDWQPAAFPVHNDYYALNGAHASISTECVMCHNGDYVNTPNTCIGCHQADYEATSDPNHSTAQFSTDCITCHNENAWVPADFDHDVQYFPIYSGAHEGQWAQCIDCHINPANYAEVTCITCHMQPETDDQHTGVNGYTYSSTACIACHPTGSADDIFDHSLTAFPLTGAHLTVECLSCHSAGFTGTPTECAACHTPDYESAQNPNHLALGLSTDCATCHTTDPEWNPAGFPNHNDYYALNGAHALIAMECILCHNGDYINTPNTCIGCHQADFNATTNPDHQAEHYPTDCLLCHNETAWTPSSFDHSLTAFPLTGAHTTVECAMCHTTGYTGTPTECVACHTTNFEETQNPNHGVLGLSTDCATCHTTDPGWEPAQFPVHNDYYALNGAHALVATECILCHNGDYINTPNTCFGCHQPDYEGTTDPNHQVAQFSTDCATCHNENAWEPATFDHDVQYFPIYSGAHQGQWSQCIDCHTNPSNYADFTCITCHTNPETDNQHPGVTGYTYASTACLACHPTGSADDIFDHDQTGFPLTGGHTLAQCLDCHAGGFTGTPTECVACHTPDYEQSQNPGHVVLGLPTDCAMCHTTDPEWDPADFPIHNDYYALNGAHALIATECVLCHNGDYNNTPNTCVGCHLDDYAQTIDPDHEASMFPTECMLCHTETAWSPAEFDHNMTDFPLDGAHATLDCASCHASGYTGTPTDCFACHQDDFNGTTDPDHVAEGYPTECTICHNTTAWIPSDFDHNQTDFPLTGAHLVVDCASCHTAGYTGTPTDCASCHLDDYNQSSNPSHVTLGLPTECASCHTTDPEWEPATFPIHNDYYVLEGAHALIADDCIVCHNGDYNNTPNTCFGCHAGDYNNTVDPDHQAEGYPTECTVCHNQTAWVPATFDHDQTDFPLTGAHLVVDCASCHTAGYTGTPTDCASCHLDDYNQSSNPSHVTLGLPTECASCHTTDPEWEPATFPIHNDYYVLEGAHALIADDCIVCHNGDYNNTPNTCFGCHANDYNNTVDPDHQAEGYPTECTVCHNQTAWIPATFDHDQTDFPLTGAHLIVDCASCHSAGYSGTPTDCAACHLTDYNGSTNPSHTALGLSTDCAMCHTTDPEWNPADFPVHNNYYALNGAHALIADDCVICHNGDYNNTPNTCVGCHLDDYNATNDPDHEAAQFPTDCILCHNENAWVPSTFDHDDLYFPIYDGKHEDEWNQCSDCHFDPTNYSLFTCLTCHSPGETNEEHEEVGGYVYESNACLQCHPDGED